MRLQSVQWTAFAGVLFLLFVHSANADQAATNYNIPADVLDSGGADVSKSNSYTLSDSIGESVIGYGSTNNYILNSGYRQPSASDFISLSCSSFVNLGTVVGTGQRSGSGTCTVYTDAYDGYRLIWHAGTDNQNGLQSHWRFEETSGTTAYDSTGNGKDATLTNGAAVSTSIPSRYRSNRSVSFDGTDDYASTNATIPQDENTVSLWVYLNSSSSKNFGQGIFWSYPTFVPHLMLLEKNGSLRTYNYNRVSTNDIGSGTNYSTVGSISTGQWHHVALVHQNNTETTYVDGVQQSIVSYNPTGGSNGQFRLSWAYWGVAHANQDYLNGNVDDVRIFNRALSSEAIRDLATLAPPGSLTASGSQTAYIGGYNFPFTGSLLGHWKMDELTAGSTVVDSSGYNNDGTPNGAGGTNNLPQPTTNIPSSANFKTVRSLNFDGTDDYVALPNILPSTATGLTVGAWVYLTANGNYPHIFTQGVTQLSLRFEAATRQPSIVLSGGQYWAIAPSAIPLNTWTHVAGTFDGSTAILYVNGVSVQTDTTGTFAGLSTDTANIGRRDDGFYFPGNIDDLRVYKRVLSAAEIKAITAIPQSWSVAATDAAWGARLSSRSTDTDSKWGTDGSSDVWLNIGEGSYPLVRRQTATPLEGSTEIIDFRAEVGTSKVQQSGVYTGVASFTVVGY